MNTKTIQTPKGLIVWDSFRGSFTMLMNTVPLLLECKITFDIKGYVPKPKLLFVAHQTNWLQEETRIVIKENSFGIGLGRESYEVDEINDSILVEGFNSFFDKYIADEEKKHELPNWYDGYDFFSFLHKKK